MKEKNAMTRHSLFYLLAIALTMTPLVFLVACQELPTGGETSNIITESEPDEGPASQRMSDDPRAAVYLEALYALMGPDWRVGRVIGGNAAGDWNYLETDINAYNWIKARYEFPIGSGWQLYYSNIHQYGFYGNYGRGGQCAGFVNALLYRSGVYQQTLRSYRQCREDFEGPRNFTKPASQALLGDIIRTRWDNGHTALVVKVMSGRPGQSVTSVDVIDSNVVGDEIIGRHIISVDGTGSGVGDLDNYYAVDLDRMGVR